MSKIKNKSRLMLGLMSGTSLDGIDMALCEFGPHGVGFHYKILKATTVKYPLKWEHRLREAKSLTAEQYFELDALYGRFIGEKINRFLSGHSKRPDAVASHGHTVFHQPHKGFSVQVGSGAAIAATTGITTVCDFRSLDVALSGQGAPLVPVGDHFLFGSFGACLNLGGIANISFEKNGKRLAYDICEANMLLNHLAGKMGKSYDKGGKIAASGKINRPLLAQLNAIGFYRKKGAKSIGREWFEKHVEAVMRVNSLKTMDQLATATEHIADIIAADLNKHRIKNVLITGGGAFNSHLISRIGVKTATKLIIPSSDVINFKEALIFAFLGYLRLNSQINTLSSVTGSRHDSVGGAVYKV